MNNSNNNLPTFSLYRSIGIINKCAACLVCTLVSLDDGDTQQKNVVVYKSRQNHSQKRGKKKIKTAQTELLEVIGLCRQ